MNIEQKHTEKNAAFIRTPQRRLVTITQFFLTAILLLSIVTVDAIAGSGADTDAMTEAAINRRIAPVAGFVLVDPNAPNPSKVDDSLATTPTPTQASTPPVASASPGSTINPAGEKLYNTNCFACHNSGIAGAPKLGNKAVWAPYIATGMDAMMEVVMRGKGAMPPKGGAMNASDDDLRAAVEYMINAAK